MGDKHLKNQRKEFGERLRRARKLRGYTQNALAAASGVSQSAISKIERGDQLASIHSVDLAKELRVNPIWLSNNIGDMEDFNHVNFDTFMTECFIYTIENTKHLNPSLFQITTIAEAIYNNGKSDGEISLSVFEPLLKMISSDS